MFCCAIYFADIVYVGSVSNDIHCDDIHTEPHADDTSILNNEFAPEPTMPSMSSVACEMSVDFRSGLEILEKTL